MKRILLLFAVACVPLQDVQKMVADAKCETYCRHAGYDSGKYSDKNCFCLDQVEFERAIQKRIIIPRRAAKRPSGSSLPMTAPTPLRTSTFDFSSSFEDP
jgi:hypothetical protein